MSPAGALQSSAAATLRWIVCARRSVRGRPRPFAFIAAIKANGLGRPRTDRRAQTIHRSVAAAEDCNAPAGDIYGRRSEERRGGKECRSGGGGESSGG